MDERKIVMIGGLCILFILVITMGVTLSWGNSLQEWCEEKTGVEPSYYHTSNKGFAQCCWFELNNGNEKEGWDRERICKSFRK